MKSFRSTLCLLLALGIMFGGISFASADEVPEISYVSFYCGDIVDGNYAEKIIEEKFGVDIKAMKLDLSDTQAMNLMLASGDMPDCGWNLGNAYNNYQQEILRTIPEDMIRKYAPNYAAVMDSDPLGWKLNVADDGNYYALNGYIEGRATMPTYASVYRLDWLENLGISVNGELLPLDDSGRLFMATEPFTLSQMTEILRAFTEDDPDGNGVNDTYGVSPSTNDAFCWSNIQGAFGIHKTGGLKDSDGSINYWYASERYKAFLKWTADAYAKGYIDKEYATLNRNQSWQKFANSQCGYACSSFEWTGRSVTWATTRPPMVIMDSTENGKVVVVPTEVADDGTGGSPAYQLSNYNYGFVVNADVDDEKLALILQIFDWCNYSDETTISLRYGEEGTHFNYDENGCPVLNEGVTLGGEYGFLVYGTDYVQTKAFQELKTAKDQRLILQYRGDTFSKWITYPDNYDMFNETNLVNLNNDYQGSIDVLVNEYYNAVIHGEKNVDETWDEYISMLNGAGYDEMFEELQKTPSYAELTQAK